MLLRLLRAAVAALALASPVYAASYPRYWQPVQISGADLPSLLGVDIDALDALRCEASFCSAMALQVDERDAAGNWALPAGALPNRDEQPGVLDDNDVVLFMVDDAGARAPETARLAGAQLEIEIGDPLGFPPRYAYLRASRGRAPASPRRYVRYDPELDRCSGRVTLGFADGIPQFLALRPEGENLLDRLKIRATATFLWGLISITRTEQDLLPDAVTWKAGPIRIIRRQPLEIRMRFGIRSPRFTSTTFFYRDFAQLPLAIRLRVPPRVFFTSIRVNGGLDFRQLPGAWRARLPGQEALLPAGCRSGAPEVQRDGIRGDWFALEGEDLTIVQQLARGATLESVREETWYRNGRSEDPPENEVGQCPGAGFTLDDWDGVEGGVHTLTSVSYALDADLDVGVFLATVETPLAVGLIPLVEP